MLLARLFLLVIGSIIIVSCAHHRDVRPGAGGIHRVVVRAPDQETAERSAIKQAEHFCQERNLHAAIVEEKKTEYTGSMDEKTRDTVKKASTAAMVLGGGTGVLSGSPGTRTAGTAVGAAGTAGAIMTGGDDYLADLKFKCE